MLVEYTHLETEPEQTSRRWLADEYFDLYLCYDDEHTLVGWQLCYGKPLSEHALTWKPGQALIHEAIDDGESRPGRLKSSPVLHQAAVVPTQDLVALFRAAIGDLDDPDLRSVLAALSRV